MSDYRSILERRDFLKVAGLGLGSAVFGSVLSMIRFEIGQGIVAGASTTANLRDHLLLPTPSCGDDDGITPRVSEGPFYAPSTPKRIDLRPAQEGGQSLRLAGRVLDTSCKPIAGAVLDFWQTDPNGDYDHFGYDFRGHQFTDAQGRYELLTWLPVSYTFMGISRRRHIHMKTAAPNHKLLTTQVFFPFGEDAKVEDFSFNRKLVIDIMQQNSPLMEARFDFVIERV